MTPLAVPGLLPQTAKKELCGRRSPRFCDPDPADIDSVKVADALTRGDKVRRSRTLALACAALPLLACDEGPRSLLVDAGMTDVALPSDASADRASAPDGVAQRADSGQVMEASADGRTDPDERWSG